MRSMHKHMQEEMAELKKAYGRLLSEYSSKSVCVLCASLNVCINMSQDERNETVCKDIIDAYLRNDDNFKEGE